MLDISVVSPILVGRVDDLASLDQLLEQAARGAGRVALIAAEAGLGKSRLVAEAVRRAEQRGVQVFRGYCFETDRAFPYAPLIDLLRNYCETRSTAEIARTFQSTASELVRIYPELKTNFPHLKPAPAIDPEQDKRRLFAALEHFLTAQFGPVAIVVIEDLHWADETSLEFLLYLARRTRQTPLLLLLTYRSDEVHPPLEHFLAELDRSRLATELRLTPLAKSETDAMLRAIFELSRPVRSEFLDVLYPLTEGNPFFIEEILKSLIIAGDIFYADGNWDRKPIKELNVPRTIRDAVQRRAHGLSAAARELLSLAAVAGQRFDFSLLKDLAGRREDELLARLKELIAAQLIVEESADRFAFRHALTREAIYSQLLARERIALHKRIAEALERREEQEIENIAYHFYQAQDWPKAEEYAQRAGERALALYAPRAALVHYSHALEAGKRLGKLPPAGLLRARGEAYETVGDFEHARADLVAALEISRSEQDHRALWQASIGLGKLWASRDYARTGDYFQQALELARGIKDPTMLAHSLNRIGNWHSNLDRPLEARAAHQEALTIFQKLEDSRGLAETQDLMGMANFIGGDLIQSAQFFARAIASFRELNERQGWASSLTTLALCSATLKTETLVLPTPKLSDADQYGEQALRITRDIEWRAGEAYALWALAAVLTAQGSYTRALELAEQARLMAEETEHRQWITAANRTLGAIYFDLLDMPQALHHFEQALTLAREIGSLHWIRVTAGSLALAHLTQKHFAEAESELNAMAPDMPMESVGTRLVWLARAEFQLAQDDANSALDIAERLIASAVNLKGGQRIIPRLWKLRGDALAMLGNLQAGSVLRTARDAAAEQGALPLLWRIDLSLGRLSQKANADHFVAARKTIEQLAHNISDEVQRDNFVQRAFALLPGATVPSPRQIAKKQYGGLTTREREIAGMIAHGKSNREIAHILVVSERTVETHVGNILAKLGFGSRAQIAAWATETGLR